MIRRLREGLLGDLREISVVIDTNKLISCLIRSGVVRYLFLNPNIVFYAPPYIFDELEEHRSEILEKTPNTLFQAIVSEAKRKIIIVELKKPTISIARRIAENFDYNDYPFIAVALDLGIPIWSNDKELIRYGLESEEYIAIDSIALQELLYGLSLNEVVKRLRSRYLLKT